MRLLSFLLSCTIVLAGCAAHQSAAPPVLGSPASLSPPDVVQNGTNQHWKQFTPKTASTIYRGITGGPDGDVWFADNNGNALVRTSMTGRVKSFVLSFTENGIVHDVSPLNPMVGADGKFYVTTDDLDPKNGKGIIGVLTTSGSFRIHDSPSGDFDHDNSLGLGPDGNIWFAEQKHIAKITPTGTITEFAYPSESDNTDAGVVTGPDGNVWFTEFFAKKVAKINPATGVITEFDVTGAGCSSAQGLAVGTDGDLYFICASNALGKITMSGGVTPIPNPLGTSLNPQDIIQGPNGHIWFVGANNTLGDYNEHTGALTTHASPFTTNGLMIDLTDGPDGNVWVTDNGGHVEVYILATLTVSPKTLTFTGIGQSQTLTATYKGPSTLSATSASPSVATVAPGQVTGTFVVTSQGVGSTKVTVMDAIGNSFVIPVTVQ